MAPTLDPATEQRIQREAVLRIDPDPAQLINRALDFLIEAESWTEEEKAEFDCKLDQSLAQIGRGEGIPGDQVRAILEADRAATRSR